jgi:hypothetical protein
MARLAGVSPQAFLAGIKAQLGQESVDLLSQAYGITPDMDNNLFITRGMQWVGDVIFGGERTIHSTKCMKSNRFSTQTLLGSIPHHSYQQEGLSLHIRRSQPFPW